ncbi:hypothetical protein FOE78_00675 [Microlunatus elymi]|uniref:Tetracyclin repressor-like C-terminal domain-containing protein n=2 Tax=Microlunatus elymi TaxID=2596828 RepID=A0A516PTW9_9ACTN|nr:hypothetical protein FOE78_00675 [Microlunatus elymi]
MTRSVEHRPKRPNQLLSILAGQLANAPEASLAMLRSVLTNPEAANAASTGIARYQKQIARAIPSHDAQLRAAIISAITFGVTLSRHLIKSPELADADPDEVIALLRPAVLCLVDGSDSGSQPRVAEG